MRERESVREVVRERERKREWQPTTAMSYCFIRTYVRCCRQQDFSLGLSCVVSDELGRRTTDFPGSLVQTTEGSLYQKCPSYTSICHRATYCLGVDVWTICFLQRQ
jgi:hypothetical protein